MRQIQRGTFVSNPILLSLMFVALACACAHAERCKKASKSEREEVDRGNHKKDAFLKACQEATSGSAWCEQVIRPNPKSEEVFACTYGATQVHQLIHPSESTWDAAFAAIEIVEELNEQGIQVCLINNWWRPEPYNQNVGGARGRHPFGTSVDVRLCTLEDKEKAFVTLCKMRENGRIHAVGYYATNVLHIGVADKRHNTWGKACP